jgi:hypothetical protein
MMWGANTGAVCKLSRFQVSGVRFQVSAPPLAAEAAGLIEKETEVSYKLNGIGYKIEGAGRLHAIDSDSFRTRPRARSRESEFYR